MSCGNPDVSVFSVNLDEGQPCETATRVQASNPHAVDHPGTSVQAANGLRYWQSFGHQHISMFGSHGPLHRTFARALSELPPLGELTPARRFDKTHRCGEL